MCVCVCIVCVSLDIYVTCNVFLQIKRLYTKRWTQLHNAVHGAAFCLDPEYHWFEHASNVEAYAEFLTMCDHVHGENSPEAAKCLVQYSMYKDKRGVFAHTSVWNSSRLMRAAEWWRVNGVSTPELQKVAVRVLSAPVSAGAGERVWSAFGLVLSDLRNRMTSEHAKKLVYVNMNSRALEKVAKVDYVSEAFEWDQPSIDWANNGFVWEEEEKDTDEVSCGEDGNPREIVSV